jgi:hypothetical protein
MDDLIRIVFLSALAFNGMLAGMSLDQGIKQLPARKRIGPAAYAQYDKAADLGPGVTLYSVFGIAAALLVLARRRQMRRCARSASVHALR